MVTDFAGDMLCTYAEGREHDASPVLKFPRLLRSREYNPDTT